MKPMSRSSQAVDEADLRAAEQLARSCKQMTAQLGRVIIGQQEVLKQVLIALFCQGHCILEGVPGLAKTLMIASIAQLLSLKFGRIQFTPDLMPSDITGTEILEEEEGTGRRRMKFVKGPIFANILLGDEINRTPPKTQAALLQAMQEYKVTTAGVDYVLEKPFLVLGTQNPIEQEGTYPLPEAQLDRFMFKIHVDYPTFEEELTIAENTTSGEQAKIEPVLDREGILALAANGAQGAGGPIGDDVRGATGAGDAAGVGRGAGLREEIPDVGGRPAPARRCCWAARRTPCSTAGSTSRRKTSATSPGRCCATAWERASAPTATASRPTTSSRNCSPPSANRWIGNSGEGDSMFSRDAESSERSVSVAPALRSEDSASRLNDGKTNFV